MLSRFVLSKDLRCFTICLNGKGCLPLRQLWYTYESTDPSIVSDPCIPMFPGISGCCKHVAPALEFFMASETKL